MARTCRGPEIGRGLSSWSCRCSSTVSVNTIAVIVFSREFDVDEESGGPKLHKEDGDSACYESDLDRGISGSEPSLYFR